MRPPDLIDALADMLGLGPHGWMGVDHELPPALTVREHRLILNGESVRSELLGLLPCYRIGVYLSSRARDGSGVGADAPKALRIDILADLDGHRMPPPWLQELQPAVGTREGDAFRRVHARLKSGDTLLISYLPDEGTHVALNDAVVLRFEGDGVIQGLLKRWLASDSPSLLRGDA